MKFSFSALFVKILCKLSSKWIVKVLTESGPTAAADGMRHQIEKWSDKKIDQAIKDIRERNFYGLEDLYRALEKAGFTSDVMLQWLETEKFLREHRRKYYPESE